MTEAAEVKETSCSPDLPPNSIPSLIFCFLAIPVAFGAKLALVVLICFDDQTHEVVSYYVVFVEVAKGKTGDGSQYVASLDQA